MLMVAARQLTSRTILIMMIVLEQLLLLLLGVAFIRKGWQGEAYWGPLLLPCRAFASALEVHCCRVVLELVICCATAEG